jgi:hypothetical protein
LQALCEAADSNAFGLKSMAVVSDQRTPAFILQVNIIWQASIGKAFNEGILNLKGTSIASRF